MLLFRYFRRIKKSTTFKTHFFSALCRSLFTNASIIFINSVFVKTVGGKSYSQLFFFASLASLIYYIYFAIRGEKEAFRIYKLVLGLALLVSVLCFLEPMMPVLTPFNTLLLYIFGVTVMVVDLIGTTLGPIVLQLTVNPAMFRDVYQKIVTSELVARVTAAGLIWLLSVNHWSTFYYPVAWITLLVHLFLFTVTIWRMRGTHAGQKATSPKDVATIKKNISKSFRFIVSNPMVRAAMSIMVWGHVTKFVVEYLFYQAADAKFASARQVASFVSVTTMTMILLSLVVQHLVGKRLTERLQLSTLFTFQPVNILVLGCVALVAPPFWPLVLMMVTYNVINRSIQLPISRQLLVPIPRKQRATIVSLICILMSVSTLVASGAMAALKNVLHFQDFLVILLVLGTVIFFLITGLDSFYIRNLWSSFRESRSGRWQDEPVSESLSSVELESAATYDEIAPHRMTVDLKSERILSAYASSYDREQLAAVSQEHIRLLRSPQVPLILFGLRICFLAGFPWFNKRLISAASDKDKRVREFAEIAIEINDKFKGYAGYTSIFRRQIKTLALEFLEDPAQHTFVEKLLSLLKLPDHTAAQSIVSALSDRRFIELRDVILACITEDFMGTRFTLQPVIQHMFASEYDAAHHCRELLEQLSFGKNRPEVMKSIEDNLGRLKANAIKFGADQTEEDEAKLQRFMHTLFAEEYRLCRQSLDRALTDTIAEFRSPSTEDNAMLIDMHLEFLKRSELFGSWQALMS
jgi:hypothetical protein